jgi:hypothetical protein
MKRVVVPFENSKMELVAVHWAAVAYWQVSEFREGIR